MLDARPSTKRAAFRRWSGRSPVFGHFRLAISTRAVQLAEIDGALQAIRKAAPGAPVPYYRAPEGTFSQDVQTLAASLGMRSLAWSIDTLDWSLPGGAAIVESVRSVIGTDDVVLMHDGGGNRSQTVQALAELLPWLVAHGYQFELPS